MDWQLNIPKICHFYWGGGIMVYMRYLSIKSFIKFNPDWNVIFWYPKEPFKGRSWYTDMYPPKINENVCRDYLPELKKLDITFMPVDFHGLGAKKNLAEVHKNDYIRLNVLHLYGGIWSDTDIIYFRSVNALKSNVPENKDKEIFVCIAEYGHSTGFNMAIPGSEFFETLLNNMNREYIPNSYQCWGPDMWNKYFKTLRHIKNGADIGMEAVYAHDIHNVNDLLHNVTPRFTEHSVGCHWYGGHQQWPEFFNKTAGGERNLPKCLISDLIEKV
jgi:hypothetical protein